MNKMLNALADKLVDITVATAKENYYSNMLKKNLTKQQKKLLLAIIDEKESLIYSAARNNFMKGFVYGTGLSRCVDENNEDDAIYR